MPALFGSGVQLTVPRLPSVISKVRSTCDLKENLWTSEAPAESARLDVLVYRARLIGRDPDSAGCRAGIVSSKGTVTDFRGRSREVLWVNRPAADLKTVGRAEFTGLYREDVVAFSERGMTSNEDIHSYLRHCLIEPLASPAPIDALHHALLPARHVDQVPSSAVLTLANTGDGRRIVREALGEKVAFLPYQRAGLDLTRQIAAAASEHHAVVLAGRGLVTWGDTAEESYSRLILLIESAERYLEERAPSSYVGPRKRRRSCR